MSCATRLPQTNGAGFRAARHAEGLLAELGETVRVQTECDHPAIAWKCAGLLDLSGQPDGPRRIVPLPLASAADGALLALKSLAPSPEKLPATGAELLGERARLMGLTRNGRASPTGHCRLLDCADGRIALNLAREDDWGLLPALLETEATNWKAVAAACARLSVEELVERGAMMGMAIAKDEVLASQPWLRRTQVAKPATHNHRKPLVIDLSALWAGPLAGSLLHSAGCEVIKVESTHRPDGAREGNSEFFDLLNAGKRSVTMDFHSDEGRRELAALLDRADIVIEASRPRALRQLGVGADAITARKPGKVWLRILAHADDENRIGFGDDIGVAAGLPTIMEQGWGEPLMVGDAIADPLTGLYAALAVWQAWHSGSRGLMTVSMRDVVRHAMGDIEESDLAMLARDWQVVAERYDQPCYPLRTVAGEAEPLGHSTAEILGRQC